ncbi:MAG: N-acetylmuramoyl-L-alanine amidase [Xanthobacteraceae bacterium]|jgi:N-acetylmuramoyl-L-alanine amidase
MSRSLFAPDSCVVAEVDPSPNQGDRNDGRRVDTIVLHYTGMRHADAALELLKAPGSEVSCHYFVHEDGRIVQLVQESQRAWHAGKSSWAGETDINSCSIGVEIVNPGHDHGYPPFPKRQIAAVTALCRSILTRHSIPSTRILAHSDVAPARKQDPGEKFPWQTLYDSGVGHWVKPAPIMDFGQTLRPGDRSNAVATTQKLLADYGYGVGVNGEYDAVTRDVVAAFQRHFRPERVDGVFDASTRSTLQELLANRGRTRTIAARARTPMNLVASGLVS